ncbi:tripartite motif-containing protein 16-like isoform X2 [Silurus meridionalis]|uniref:tripartite motif-containing protein 16-like isoform X2 n=1 Tax=Silurus meridionalis TaxID=175797 RepID=UPI001EEAA87E|nr:tripartite motif-containing protein 16-like isoform X2 [Silurus meridionalis]
MAETNISVPQDQFSCPICLDLFNEPVTIQCGHSFCMGCISDCWDQEDQKGVYSCPQCKETITPRPAVSKNTVLAEVTEKLKADLRSPRPAYCSSVTEDLECDFCTGKKDKAVKSCLVCLTSFCGTHLQPHYEFPAFKKHKLVDASKRLQICSHHNKLLEVFCRTDQQCICMLCMLDKHKGHDTVSASAGKAEKQKQLLKTQRKCQQRISEKEKKHQELAEAVEFYEKSAQRAVRESERIFTEMIKSMKRRRHKVRDLIKAQEKAAVSRAKEVMTQLEQEIAELKRRDAEMEWLLQADSICFLQGFLSLLDTPISEDLDSIRLSTFLSLEDVTAFVAQLKDKVEAFCCEEVRMVSNTIKELQILPLPEPKSREEFLQHSYQFTLDPNTVNKHLCLSERNTVVTCTETAQSYLAHPERFDYYLQGLCREGICGRCYWELEWTGRHGVSIAVSYKTISRKGKDISRLHSSSSSLHTITVFHSGSVPWRPVLVADGFTTHPVPEAQSAGVTQTNPHIGGDVFSGVFNPVLYILRVNIEQVHMVLSAEPQSFSPCLLLSNHFDWRLFCNQTKKIIVTTTVYY